jgi:hypothetical protein
MQVLPHAAKTRDTFKKPVFPIKKQMWHRNRFAVIIPHLFADFQSISLL